jgi:HlyD family secretion protein
MSLYRPTALAHLHAGSPPDPPVRVVGPAAWLALASVASIVGVALVWGVVGRVPTTVAGHGLLIRAGGTFAIVTQGGGLVEAVRVQVGQLVERGQVLAQVAQPVLHAETTAAQTEHQRTATEYAEAQALYAAGDQLYATALQQQRSAIDFSLQANDRRRTALRTTLETQRKAFAQQSTELELTETTLKRAFTMANDHATRTKLLLDRSAVSVLEYETSVRDRDQAEVKLRTAQAERAKLVVTTLQAETAALKEEDQLAEASQNLRNKLADLAKEDAERTSRRREELFAKRQTMLAAKAKWDVLAARWAKETTVVSPYRGRVVEVDADVGNVIAAGSVVASVEFPDEPLQVLVVVPAKDGKRITVGCRLEVTPSTVQREEVGFMPATVAEVDEFPLTEEALYRLVANKALVKELMGRGTVLGVLGTLPADAAAPSGYRWSSGRGPDVRLQSGTECRCAIRVREQAPLTLVVPALKRWLGID